MPGSRPPTLISSAAPGSDVPNLIRSIAILIALATLSLPVGASAGPSPQRTIRIRLAVKGQPNGASAEPQLSGDGRFVAFTSQATNLLTTPIASPLSRVFLYDEENGAIRLVSVAPNGRSADGPSSQPAVANDGSVVVFMSSAHDLVTADTVRSDVFAWSSARGVQRVSVPATGVQANGASDEPDVSSDGRFVVFRSAASNLVGQGTGPHVNVFVRDLLLGNTYLVSVAPSGGAANGDSGSPAISPDGRYVSFATTATNLVAGQPTHRSDIVVRDLVAGISQLASVSSSGQEQNAAVAAPFSQLSDVSAGGRFVAFDSDATNLIRNDHNHHTDVFVHDMKTKMTVRASLATTDQEPNSDSFAPRITPDGRYVIFASFARNLAPFEPAGPNVFVRDLLRHTTVMVDVSASGRPRRAEHIRQLLQRPSISDDGSVAGFVSTATNLVAGDTNNAQDVFLRRLTPAPITLASHQVGLSNGHIVITFVSSDRQAGPLLCRLDHRPAALCPLGQTILPTLRSGTHRLYAYAGGQGTVYATEPIVVRIRAHNRHTEVKVTNPGSRLGLGG
jgi:Tol biopolymer transport system component